MIARRESRGVSLSLAGWLWADILLGLFAIFLAASAVASAGAPKSAPGIDPKPLEFRVSVNGSVLLSSDQAAIATEQQRIAADVAARVASNAPGRQVAMVFAYGSSEVATDGDHLAQLATEPLTTGAFQGAVLKAYHELVAGDAGTAVSFEIYFNE